MKKKITPCAVCHHAHWTNKTCDFCCGIRSDKPEEKPKPEAGRRLWTEKYCLWCRRPLCFQKPKWYTMNRNLCGTRCSNALFAREHPRKKKLSPSLSIPIPSQELDWKKEEVRRNNNVIENFENWKEAKRLGKNPPEFMSLDRVDEVIISAFV